MRKNKNNRKNVYDLESDVRNLNRQISQLTSELNEKRSELARHRPTFDFANWYTLTNKTLAFFNKAGVRRSENV